MPSPFNDKSKQKKPLTKRIGRQKSSSHAANQSDGLFIRTLDLIRDGVIIINSTGIITRCNKVAEQMLDFEHGELQDKHISYIYTLWDVNTIAKTTEVLTALSANKMPYHTQNPITVQTKKHNHRYIDILITPNINQTGQLLGFIVTCQDVSSKMRMQETMFNSKKLESIGLLAGGIAHDFNNILTTIMGNITLAKIYSNPKDKAYEILTEAEKACLKSKDLTQQLLTFSRGGNPIKKPSHIDTLVTESVKFILRNYDVKCNFLIDDDLYSADIDDGQINQVLNNIVLNAVQATGGKGTITIALHNGFDASYRNVIGDTGEQKFVRIEIKDDGCGIPPENIDKIFDPYFSTKGDGSGLGLAISHSIIKKHGGYIFVSSEQNVGTTFTLILPAADKREIKRDKSDMYIRHQNLNILVMDDEKSVRDVTGKLLSLIGHNVSYAADGDEAIKMYKDRFNTENKFDVVFMDLVVPGKMGGEEAIKHLLAYDPFAKCIISSGYSDNEVMSDYALYGFKGLITKPYKIEDLLRVLNETI